MRELTSFPPPRESASLVGFDASSFGTLGRSLTTTTSDKLGFVDGIWFFFRGFGLLAKSGSIGLALVPVGVAIFLTFSLWFLVVWFIPSLVASWTSATGTWLAVVQVLATLACMVLSVLVGLALAQPASGPAIEAIVRRVEKRLGVAPHPESTFLAEVGRSAGSAAIGFGFGITATVALLLLGLIPGAVVVTVPLQVVATALSIGWDLCDLPLSVRGLPIGQRVKLVFGNFRVVLGFSMGLVLVSLIPCGFFLFFPVGVAGATALVRALEEPSSTSRPQLKSRVG